jgi:hypothetical protein
MIELDRRRAMMGGVAVAAGVLLPALALAAEPRVVVFIVDRRLEESRAAAARWQRQGAFLLDPRETDLGRAWRGIIPDRIGNGLIAGLTLWSDYFICASFAREAGVRPHGPQVRHGQELYSWSFA